MWMDNRAVHLSGLLGRGSPIQMFSPIIGLLTNRIRYVHIRSLSELVWLVKRPISEKKIGIGLPVLTQPYWYGLNFILSHTRWIELTLVEGKRVQGMGFKRRPRANHHYSSLQSVWQYSSTDTDRNNQSTHLSSPPLARGNKRNSLYIPLRFSILPVCAVFYLYLLIQV